jgi:hypothetical protein
MENLVSKVLNRCGYGFMEPTQESLVKCFLDYVQHGVFKEFDYDQVKRDIEEGDVTLKLICYSLISVK